MLKQLHKILRFYLRFLPSFTRLGFIARGLPWCTVAADFRGQTWLVTGASGGIGREIALEAARRGAGVLAVARSAARLHEVIEARADGDGAITAEVVDLALRRETAALVDRLAARGQCIDVLVNNVGVLLDDFSLTAEGLETSLATNLVNHFLLTGRLVEKGLLAEQAVVIDMSSGGMYNAPLRVGAMRMDERNYNGVAAYGLHKRAQVALSAWWRAQQAGSGRHFYVMHPGWADTAGVRTSLPRFRRLLHPVLRTARDGADTAIWLVATRPAQAGEEGVWFDRALRPAHVFPETRTNSEPVEKLVTFLREHAELSTLA